MVVEELGEEAGGKAPHLRRVGGPHRRGLRHEQPLDEVVRVAAVGQEAAERRALPAAADQLAGLAVEADQIAQHAVKARVERVRRAREQPAGPGGRPFEAAAAVGDGEAHVGRLRGDPELGQHALEVRVVELVEDDEAGVDREAAPRASRRRSCWCGRPGSRAASKTWTSCPARWSSAAATRPETPAPTMAIRLRLGEPPHLRDLGDRTRRAPACEAARPARFRRPRRRG